MSSEAETFDDRTPPDTLLAMRRAVDANTAQCKTAAEQAHAAANWAEKAYLLVSPIVAQVNTLEEDVADIKRRGFMVPNFVSTVALIAAVCSLLLVVLVATHRI